MAHYSPERECDAADAPPTRAVVNFRPEGMAPYESLWSLVHKITYLNHTQALAVYKTFGGSPTRKTATVMTFDLLALDGIDTKKLSLMLRVPIEALRYATVEPYQLPTTLFVERDVERRRLRFCPACIENGYHTPLFQVQMIVRCPIHDSILEEKCPRCREHIQYHYTRYSRSCPYGCSCGYTLWGGRDDKTWKPGITQRQAAWIESYLAWLNRVPTIKALALRDLAALNFFAQRDRKIASYWHEAVPIPGWSPEYFRRVPTELMGKVNCGLKLTRSGRRRSNRRQNEREAIRKALHEAARAIRPIYKSIRRKIQRRLRHHRRCTRRLKAYAQSPYAIQRALCPEVQALFAWRAQWEGRDAVNFDYDNDVTNTHHKFNFSITRLLEHVSKRPLDDAAREALFAWLLQHLCAINILASYHECLVLAHKPDTEYVPRPEGRFSPYYLWIPGTTRHCDQLLWWAPPILNALEAMARVTPEHRRAVNAFYDAHLQYIRDEIERCPSLRERVDH